MFSLAKIFANGMTLQRHKSIKIWGNSNAADIISVFINGRKITDIEIPSGRFEFYLPAQEAMESGEIEFVGKTNEVKLDDVDIGEVWLAGGQSNMAFLLKHERSRRETIAVADDPHFRFYDVGKYSFLGERDETIKGSDFWERWHKFTPESAPAFSAVGTYFATELRKTQKVPVAIVGCNYGGTSATTWMDTKYLAEDADLAVFTDTYNAAVKNLDSNKYYTEEKKKREQGRTPAMEILLENLALGRIPKPIMHLMKLNLESQQIITGPCDVNRPGGLYETMMPEIKGYTVKGVIWYQGESDDKHAEIYAKLFKSMIDCWRRDWQDDLPFLFVQLAPFSNWLVSGGENYPEIRRQQAEVENSKPNCFMACIMDVGKKNDIHPKNKKTVGYRLSLLARNKIYGEKILAEAPKCIGMEVGANVIFLEFENAGTGLKTKGGSISELDIFVDDKKLKNPKIEVEKGTLKVLSEKITGQSNIRVVFAQVPYCVVNLYNSADLPAKPFEITNY